MGNFQTIPKFMAKAPTYRSRENGILCATILGMAG
jgi:hypothetical protein